MEREGTGRVTEQSVGHDESHASFEKSSLSIPLTDEQFQIVRCGPDAKILVTAGPGTGKTHVLVARIAALIRFHGVSPGRGLLVLSFSRAAVATIRDRVRELGGDVAFVRAYTFDSFATRLLAQFEPEGAWADESYDGRIEHAVRLIGENTEAKAFLSEFEHLLVDEIQDLVGVRSELVKALLDAVNGFTLLGDPAQGIYNYQLDTPADRRFGSKEIYFHVELAFLDEIRHFTLTENHRVTSDRASAALWAGPALNRSGADYREVGGKLRDLLADFSHLGALESALPRIADWVQHPGSVAILCRTNSQALVAARTLLENGIPCVLQQSATDRMVVPWVGELFGTFRYGQISRGQFENLIAGAHGCSLKDPAGAWNLLKRVDNTRGNNLNLATLADRIRTGYVPDELTFTVSGRLVISTVHRAKGREFDRVIIVEPNGSPERLDDIAYAEETRVLYVALTRAKQDIYILEAPDTRGIFTSDFDGRRIKGGTGRYSWQTYGLELQGRDVHRKDPAGAYLIDGDARRLQSYIRENVHQGDALVLRHIASEEEAERPVYLIEHEGMPVGVTSESFGNGLRYAIRRKWYSTLSQVPQLIEDVRVQAVDTVAWNPASGRKAALNETGIWLRVRVVGLGMFQDWQKIEQEEDAL